MVARNKPEVYCLTRSTGNRRRDVLGPSRELPVERDGRFPTTKICSHADPLLLPSSFGTFPSSSLTLSLSLSVFLSLAPFSAPLSAPIYLPPLTLETRVRVHRRKGRTSPREGKKSFIGKSPLATRRRRRLDSQYRVRAALIINRAVTVNRYAPPTAIKLYIGYIPSPRPIQ